MGGRENHWTPTGWLVSTGRAIQWTLFAPPTGATLATVRRDRRRWRYRLYGVERSSRPFDSAEACRRAAKAAAVRALRVALEALT